MLVAYEVSFQVYLGQPWEMQHKVCATTAVAEWVTSSLSARTWGITKTNIQNFGNECKLIVMEGHSFRKNHWKK